MQTINNYSYLSAGFHLTTGGKTKQDTTNRETIVSSLVDATLHTLDDSMLAAANWVLELLDKMDDLMEATGIKITMDDIKLSRKSWKTFRK